MLFSICYRVVVGYVRLVEGSRGICVWYCWEWCVIVGGICFI